MMNIRTATKTAKDVKIGIGVPIKHMQAAFDRLSNPDQLHSVEAADLRKVLWNTNKVNLAN